MTEYVSYFTQVLENSLST